MQTQIQRIVLHPFSAFGFASALTKYDVMKTQQTGPLLKRNIMMPFCVNKFQPMRSNLSRPTDGKSAKAYSPNTMDPPNQSLSWLNDPAIMYDVNIDIHDKRQTLNVRSDTDVCYDNTRNVSCERILDVATSGLFAWAECNRGLHAELLHNKVSRRQTIAEIVS